MPAYKQESNPRARSSRAEIRGETAAHLAADEVP